VVTGDPVATRRVKSQAPNPKSQISPWDLGLEIWDFRPPGRGSVQQFYGGAMPTALRAHVFEQPVPTQSGRGTHEVGRWYPRTRAEARRMMPRPLLSLFAVLLLAPAAPAQRISPPPPAAYDVQVRY